MSKYRDHLPQLGDDLYLTDSGLETTLIFHDGYELPAFAAFVLLDTAEGRAHLADYYRRHAAIARTAGAGFVLESVGWRANPDWGAVVGYPPERLDQVNRDSIELLVELRDELESPDLPMVISGCIGPRYDAYDPAASMTAAESEQYHARQVAVYREAGADLVSALTITNTSEAIGIVLAARTLDMPVVISFTVETDGRLPSGDELGDAIRTVDAATGGAAQYFMLNCAHPTHFSAVLDDQSDWMRRLRGLRANSSTLSHAELDDADTLDDGDPEQLGREYAALRARFPQLTVLGGCCGTDHRHVRQIAEACTA